MGKKRDRDNASRTKLKSYADIDARFLEMKFVARSQTALWDYLERRFNEFWKQQDCPKRRVPNRWHDPDHDAIGWFFPAKWAQDFEAIPKQREEAA